VGYSPELGAAAYVRRAEKIGWNVHSTDPEGTGDWNLSSENERGFGGRRDEKVNKLLFTVQLREYQHQIGLLPAKFVEWSLQPRLDLLPAICCCFSSSIPYFCISILLYGLEQATICDDPLKAIVTATRRTSFRANILLRLPGLPHHSEAWLFTVVIANPLLGKSRLQRQHCQDALALVDDHDPANPGMTLLPSKPMIFLSFSVCPTKHLLFSHILWVDLQRDLHACRSP
jgi:hypothetical protein